MEFVIPRGEYRREAFNGTKNYDRVYRDNPSYYSQLHLYRETILSSARGKEGGSNLIQTRLKQIRIQFLRRSIRDRLG